MELERKFSSLSRSNILQLKSKLQNMKKGTLSMTEYLRQMKKILDTLVSVSASLEEEDIVLHILNGLPPDYNPFKTTIRAISQPN